MVSPPFDAALAAAVKAQEKKTGEKAPYFGAETRDEALALDAWKNIGEEWGDRAPMTCWGVYTERYPVGGKMSVRYTAEAKAEVLSGKRDAELKKVVLRLPSLLGFAKPCVDSLSGLPAWLSLSAPARPPQSYYDDASSSSSARAR